MIDIDLLLCWGAAYKKLSKDEYLFREHDHARYYYQVVDGKIRMMNLNESGKEFIQGFFSPGESFGEPPLFDQGPYPANALAEEDSTVIRLTKESFLQMLQEHPDILLKFTRLLAKRLRFKSLVSKEISSYGPEHRILALMQHFKSSTAAGHSERYKLDITRQQVADMTGLRVETVIRTLRQLHLRGDVLIRKGKVYY